jgi:hypothetical protein
LDTGDSLPLIADVQDNWQSFSDSLRTWGETVTKAGDSQIASICFDCLNEQLFMDK